MQRSARAQRTVRTKRMSERSPFYPMCNGRACIRGETQNRLTTGQQFMSINVNGSHYRCTRMHALRLPPPETTLSRLSPPASTTQLNSRLDSPPSPLTYRSHFISLLQVVKQFPISIRFIYDSKSMTNQGKMVCKFRVETVKY